MDTQRSDWSHSGESLVATVFLSSSKLICMSIGAIKIDNFPLLVLEGLLFSFHSVHYIVDMFYIQ